MNNYDDIINLEHFEPKYHKRMSPLSRAAQFAPFAALTGYDEEVKETARRTNKKKILNVDEIEVINETLNKIKKDSNITVTYFIPDKYKQGGKYIDYTGIVRRIDNIYKTIYFIDKTKIYFKDIIKIEINV